MQRALIDAAVLPAHPMALAVVHLVATGPLRARAEVQRQPLAQDAELQLRRPAAHQQLTWPEESFHEYPSVRLVRAHVTRAAAG